MGELSDKEFKMAVLRKLNDLEENRDKCFNTLRKKLYKELKEFKKI
jgi:formiminotetrahydrofolate cyclodeaminase